MARQDEPRQWLHDDAAYSQEMSEGAKDAVTKGAAAGLGALAGAALGPAGAVTGAMLGPVFEPAMRRVWDELTSDSRVSAEQVLVEASSYSGTTPEDFADCVRQDEDRRLLGGIAFAAGSRTRNKDKIRGLGRALADGVLAEDDARLDETHLILRALDDLEAPHIAVLDLLANCYPGVIVAGEQIHPPKRIADDPSTRGYPDSRRRWRMYEFEFARPGFSGSVASLLGTLQRHGLAVAEQDIKEVLERYQKDAKQRAKSNAYSSQPTFRTQDLEIRWSVTGLGAHVLDYILAKQCKG